jgi:hypothetical protein
MTNKYEDFINRLITDTEGAKITWEVAGYRDYEKHITNPELIIRAFSTLIDQMQVVLLDGKYNKYISDFDSYIEIRDLQVLLIKDGVVAKIIDEEIVNQEYIQGLVEVVAEKSLDIDKDIDKFLET